MEENNSRRINHWYVASTLNRDLCSIMINKTNKKGGMADLINDVTNLRINHKDMKLTTKDALKLILETAKELQEINKLAIEEYNLQ